MIKHEARAPNHRIISMSTGDPPEQRATQRRPILRKIKRVGLRAAGGKSALARPPISPPAQPVINGLFT